jgi:hypothetical protein
LNSLAGRAAVKYRDVFHTTQAAAKIVPALRVVTEKAPLMSADGQAAITIPAIAAFGHPCPSYAGAPGRRAPVCVAYMDVGQGREQDTEALLVVYLE